jgi:hypothetical protein
VAEQLGFGQRRAQRRAVNGDEWALAPTPLVYGTREPLFPGSRLSNQDHRQCPGREELGLLDNRPQDRPHGELLGQEIVDGFYLRDVAGHLGHDPDPLSEPEHLPARQRPFLDARAVDKDAVSAVEVPEHVAVPLAPDLGMPSGGFLPRQMDRASLIASKQHRGFGQLRAHATAIGKPPANRQGLPGDVAAGGFT